MDDPTAFCESQFDASLRITAPLKDLIISQVAHAHPPDTRSIKTQVHLLVPPCHFDKLDK